MSICAAWNHDGAGRSRRNFLQTASTAVAFALSESAVARLRRLSAPVRIGIIADLHHDVMHDGEKRLDTFLSAMEHRRPGAIMQLGDFAVPSKKNRSLIEQFNNAHSRPLHVLGNHDRDDGYSLQQVLDVWGMEAPYYSVDVDGLHLIVLNGNELPEDHPGGYPAHIGQEQIEWLRDELTTSEGPVVIFCHQPLAGAWSIENAVQLQQVLDSASDRVLLALNGHSHIDDLVRAGEIGYLHVNSASYVWVGKAYRHASYPPEVLAAHPRLVGTCPYRDALFTTLTFDPATGVIWVEGCESQWVGKSPAELGRDKHPDLIDGEQIVPLIRARRIPQRI